MLFPKRIVLLFAIFFGLYSTSYSTLEVIDSDQLLIYTQAVFSSVDFLLWHEKLVKKGFSWDDISYCNEFESTKPNIHTVQIQFRYSKDGRKKGHEFTTLTMVVTRNSETRKSEVLKIKVGKTSIYDSDEPNDTEIDLVK
jgi:hypothetical protein